MSLAEDRDTLDQLVQMAAESAELDIEPAGGVSDALVRVAEEYDGAVEIALGEMVKVFPPKGGATPEDIFEADGAYNILMTLRGEGVGIWDGRWEEFYDDTEGPEQFLKDTLSQYADDTGGGKLNEAFDNEAHETSLRRSRRQSKLQPNARARATAELQTTKLRRGQEVLAKTYEGELYPKTYANRTQAQKAAAKLGSGWIVIGRRPFYVARASTTESGIARAASRFYSIGEGGLTPVTGGRDIYLQPGVIYYMGASSSPDQIMITGLEGASDSGAIHYKSYPFTGKEARIENEIGRDLIAQGTATELKRRKEFPARMASLKRDPGYAKVIEADPDYQADIASMEAVLAGRPGKVEDPYDYWPRYVTVEATKPASEYPRGDPWYGAEEYGGVGGLERGGKTLYEIHTNRKGERALRADDRFRVVGSSEERPKYEENPRHGRPSEEQLLQGSVYEDAFREARDGGSTIQEARVYAQEQADADRGERLAGAGGHDWEHERNAAGAHNGSTGVVFEAATRGGKYRIEVARRGDEYAMTTFTSGQSAGRATGYTQGEMLKRVTGEIYNAKKYDGINYRISHDELGVGTVLGASMYGPEFSKGSHRPNSPPRPKPGEQQIAVTHQHAQIRYRYNRKAYTLIVSRGGSWELTSAGAVASGSVVGVKSSMPRLAQERGRKVHDSTLTEAARQLYDSGLWDGVAGGPGAKWDILEEQGGGHHRPNARPGLTPSEVAQLPVGSIVYSRAAGFAMSVVPDGGLAPITVLPERAGGGEPDGEPIASFGEEFALVKQGRGKLLTEGTAQRLVITWMREQGAQHNPGQDTTLAEIKRRAADAKQARKSWAFFTLHGKEAGIKLTGVGDAWLKRATKADIERVAVY